MKNRLNNGKAFLVLSEDDLKFMMIRELFICKQLKDPKKFNQDVLKDMFPDVNQQKIEEELSEEKLKKLDLVAVPISGVNTAQIEKYVLIIMHA